jgi:hypothetical protein
LHVAILHVVRRRRCVDLSPAGVLTVAAPLNLFAKLLPCVLLRPLTDFL